MVKSQLLHEWFITSYVLSLLGCITEVWKSQLAKILSLDDFGPVLANSLDQLFEEYAKVISGT